MVEEIKAFYAGEAKKKEEEHRREIERYERQLSGEPNVKKDREMER